MVLRDDCRIRLRGALELLQRIGVARDPQIREGFQHLRNEIRRIDSAIQQTSEELSAAQQQLLQTMQSRLFRISIYAGKLLRASNARNAFEWFGPFASLFRKVVNGCEYTNDLIVFSSEWHYNLEVARMPLHAVDVGSSTEQNIAWFIGYPAFESENPNVLPIVGHEIGHALWHRKQSETLFTPKVDELIESHFVENNATSREAIGVRKHVFRQIEELFCDTVAALLFGPSFLYAFRYLLAPSGLSLGQRQNAGYPDVRTRAQYLIDLSKNQGWSLPTDFADVFQATNGEAEFGIVDGMVHQLQPLVTQAATVLLTNVAPDEFYSFDETQQVLQDFSRALPCRAPVRVSSLINAGYLLLEGHASFEPGRQVHREDRAVVLSELVFKSLELSQHQHHAQFEIVR
jgi:hypothetical protein